MMRRTAIRRDLVVVAVPDYEPTVGGTTRHTKNLAVEFLAHGADVAVLTRRVEREWARHETVDGVDAWRVGPPSRFGPHGRVRHGLAMKAFDVAAAMWFARRRRRIRAVIVIMYPDLAVAAATTGLARRTIVVWASVGEASDTLRARGVRRPLAVARLRALRHSPHVALTPVMARELVAAGIDQDLITVIPTPVDLDRFRAPSEGERQAARAALGLGDDAFAVVFMGQLRRSKRAHVLVDAVATLVHEGVDARLYLLGDARPDLDDGLPAVYDAIRAGGLDGRVVLTGAVLEVLPYLHAADVFALPSEREGLSNSLIEALACGVPGVAPTSAEGDQAIDESCGIVPPDDSAAALAGALGGLARDAELRRRLAANAPGRAAAFDLRTVSASFRALVDRLDAPRG
jgi:glycosyltransferase involved in cell wall biosynthesis